MKFVLVVLFCCVFSFNLWAQDKPTVFYGAAKTSDGKEKVFVVEQPKNAPNPLGNPIVGPDKPVEVLGNLDGLRDNQSQSNTSDTQEASENQNNLGEDFENTLLEANGRVYDVQSYPKADFKAMENPANPQTIYSPNVND